MAYLHGPVLFTGRLDELVAYKDKKTNKTIIQRVGGFSKEQFENKDTLGGHRNRSKEFGGASTTGKYLNMVLYPLKVVAGENLSALFTGFFTSLKELDTISERGEKNFYVSAARPLLEGYNLNTRNSFDSVVSNPLTCELSRDSETVTFSLPALVPGKTFSPIGNFPYYRWILAAGLVPDCFYNSKGKYNPALDPLYQHRTVRHTDWHLVSQPAAAQTIQLSLPGLVPNDNVSLLAAVGISFGRMKKSGEVEAEKGAGAGKILRVI